MKWIKCEIGNKNTFPASGVEVLIKYNNGSQKELGSKETIIELIENGWLKVEWLDETTPEATTPLQEGRELYWQKRCEAAELLLNKHCKEIPDSPEYMNWQSAIEPAATPASTQGRVYVEDWTKPVDGVINVPDELDPLVNSMMNQYAFHKHSELFGMQEAICRMAYVAQLFFEKKYAATPAPEATEEGIRKMATEKAIKQVNKMYAEQEELKVERQTFINYYIPAFIAGYKAHQGKQ